MNSPAIAPAPTPGAKMMYLIKRRPTTSREELVAHWFANHMPLVLQRQRDSAAGGKPHARRYIATLFEPNQNGEHPWDGIAQLWWGKRLPRPREPHGTQPTDTFQQKVEPYLPWATAEHVVIDPSRHLRVEPLTLNAPFPCTRSGFLKVNYLVKARPDTDFGRFYDHWLRVHVPNVASTMHAVKGFGYVVSHSMDPQFEPYAGLAELYFDDESGWAQYKAAIRPDGMQEWVDPDGTLVLRANTEMIGIP
jgi:EthD domain-containing protein